MNNDNRSALPFWLGLFMGGLIGIATMVLLSTKGGRKYARQVWKKAEMWLDELEIKLEEAELEVSKNGKEKDSLSSSPNHGQRFFKKNGDKG